MIVTKRALPRRTFLRGMGCTLALPVLEAMVPAFRTAAAAGPVTRLGFFYVPNGIYPSAWRPSGEGRAFEFGRTSASLSPLREHTNLISGLSNFEAEAKGDGGGPHARMASAWLSGARPKKTEGSDYEVGVTADQVAAAELGRHTQLRSLELGLDPGYMVGNCENGYSCVYLNTISWRTATTPLPTETDPRAVFERLFGESGTDAQRQVQLRRDRSVLDAVREDMAALQAKLGPGDSATVTEYFDAVREVEQRIQLTEQRNAESPIQVGEAPLSVPESYDEHAKLMFSLITLAYRADVTRVVAFQLGRETNGRSFPWIGVPQAHHSVSHHGGQAGNIEPYCKINAYQLSLFADFAKSLKNIPDGDGSLLDHSMLLYGAGMSDGDLHTPLDLQMALVGGGGGIKGGRYLKYPIETPMANLLRTMLLQVGVRDETFGDSNGELPELLRSA